MDDVDLEAFAAGMELQICGCNASDPGTESSSNALGKIALSQAGAALAKSEAFIS